MKNISNDPAVGTTRGRFWPRGVLSKVQRWVYKPLHGGNTGAVPLLSSVALVLFLSACGGGGGGTTSAASFTAPAQPSVPAPAPAPAQPIISGNIRAPRGLLTIGVQGGAPAALYQLAVDRQPTVTADPPRQVPLTSDGNLSPRLLALTHTRSRSPPPGCFSIPRKPVILRTLQSSGPTYGPPIAETTTDANGNYSINIPDGTSITAVLVITAGAPNEVQMSAVVTGDIVDIDPVTDAAFKVLMSYAQRNNLTSIDLDLTAELVAKIDDIAAAMAAPTDSRSAVDSYVQQAAGSAAVNSSLTAQLPSGLSPIGGSGGTSISGPGLQPGTPDTPPPPNPGSTGTWYYHFTVQACVPGVSCITRSVNSPGNNAFTAQASCLEAGRQVAAAFNANATAGITYSYVCDQTP